MQIQYSKRKSFDLVSAWNFYVDFSDLADLFQANRNVDIKKLYLYVKSVNISPSLSIDTNSVKIGMFNIENPIKLKLNGEFRISFWYDEDYTIEKIYNMWINKIYDKNKGTKFLRSDYERDIIVYMNKREYEFEINENNVPLAFNKKIVFKKCFPTSISNVSYDYSSNDFVGNVEISFRYNGGVDIEYKD